MCEASGICASGLASWPPARWEHRFPPLPIHFYPLVNNKFKTKAAQFTDWFFFFYVCVFLSAQITCSPPALTNGYFVPQQDGRTLTYSCETGFKPVVEGWWATSTCQKGEWTHTPRCVGEYRITHRACDTVKTSRRVDFTELKLHVYRQRPEQQYSLQRPMSHIYHI